MPTEDQIMELAVEGLLRRSKTYLVSAANRAYETELRSYGFDRDSARDEMIDRVETYLFNDLDWEQIPATVISDVAHEIADEVLLEKALG